MDRKVIYVAEIDQDIDDIIAVEYLNRLGVLQEVVLDPKPTRKEGWDRVEALKKKGIKISEEIPQNAEIVIVGGALTAVAKYIRFNGKIDTLVMNGGYVGANIVPEDEQLDKFKGKRFVRTFNFNIDVQSTASVLKTNEQTIGRIVLVGKNVCHNIKNTKLGIWKNNFVTDILNEYHVRDDKRQHDVLACHEGLALANLIDEKPACKYKEVYPKTMDGLKGNMTYWGSTENSKDTIYRKVESAVGYEE